MTMTVWQSVLTIAAVVLGTATTRYITFLVFPEHKEPPRWVRYLGSVLPFAMAGLLVVYSLKDVSLLDGWHGLPEAIALASVILLHKWKRNMMLSLAGGTILYMVLIQFIFV